MITIKALLLEGLKAYLTAGKTKHAIKATMRGHSLVAYIIRLKKLKMLP
jgi:hypothetical protein